VSGTEGSCSGRADLSSLPPVVNLARVPRIFRDNNLARPYEEAYLTLSSLDCQRLEPI
jgi:hypothetical protein